MTSTNTHLVIMSHETPSHCCGEIHKKCSCITLVSVGLVANNVGAVELHKHAKHTT